MNDLALGLPEQFIEPGRLVVDGGRVGTGSGQFEQAVDEPDHTFDFVEERVEGRFILPRRAGIEPGHLNLAHHHCQGGA